MLSIPLNQITKNVNSVQSMTAIMHNSIPVITTELLAGVYGTDVVRIRQNHARNTDRFYEGKHFFIIKGKELQEFKNRVSLSYSVDNNKLTESQPVELVGKRARSLTLWTERGAARHAKMLDTDQAWNVFEKLEDFYFNQKESEPIAAKTTTQSRTPLRGLVNTIMGKYGLNSKKLFQMVHHEFGVNHIDELTHDQLPSAIEYLATKAIEGEFLGRETLPAPKVKQQISDEDLQTLCWGWRFLARSIEHMANVYPVLKSAEHELAPIYREIPREGAEIEKMVRKILENVTSHIEVTPTQDNNWNILNKLRTPNYH
ncbi:ORF6N domain-containing protein [Xenorhabdus bovienii]|uniref:ORF6N domain-containing protein n=2 Tax=Xenorhabdus bovienii TaxID=40576 RepID=UPI00301C3B15|nr:ORF6N domain-containing protein [Xenorhabdus bovienii]MDE9478426.1 ORF6N domain-containing protein [Xenorhabdus bovienii]MDE9531308.1 ORF6N domain-containing protein [Xenorhabdus bovienii]